MSTKVMPVIDFLKITRLIEINSKRCGSKPTLIGTRVTVAQILSELSEHCPEVAEDLDLDVEKTKSLLRALVQFFNQKSE